MIDELLADHQLYHSDFQMDYLITVKAGGTTYGQYKQALREVYKRYRGLRDLLAERELAEVDIDEMEHAVGLTVFDQRRNAINLRRKRESLDDADRNIRDTERELARFVGQAEALKEHVGELTPERRAILDAEMWAHRIKSMIAIDLITRGTISETSLTCLNASPPEIRESLLNAMRTPDAITEWYRGCDARLPHYEDTPATVQHGD